MQKHTYQCQDRNDQGRVDESECGDGSYGHTPRAGEGQAKDACHGERGGNASSDAYQSASTLAA